MFDAIAELEHDRSRVPAFGDSGRPPSAVTVLLARFVLGERLGSTQRLGFVIAIAGIALIAAGR